jgi:hypothetical protein
MDDEKNPETINENQQPEQVSEIQQPQVLVSRPIQKKKSRLSKLVLVIAITIAVIATITGTALIGFIGIAAYTVDSSCDSKSKEIANRKEEAQKIINMIKFDNRNLDSKYLSADEDCIDGSGTISAHVTYSVDLTVEEANNKLASSFTPSNDFLQEFKLDTDISTSAGAGYSDSNSFEGATTRIVVRDGLIYNVNYKFSKIQTCKEIAGSECDKDISNPIEFYKLEELKLQKITISVDTESYPSTKRN